MVGSLQIAEVVAVGSLAEELDTQELLASFQGGILVALGHRIIDQALLREDPAGIAGHPSSEAAFVIRDTEEEVTQRTTTVEASGSLVVDRRTVVRVAFHPSLEVATKDSPFTIVVDILDPLEAVAALPSLAVSLVEAFDHIVEEYSLVVDRLAFLFSNLILIKESLSDKFL